MPCDVSQLCPIFFSLLTRKMNIIQLLLLIVIQTTFACEKMFLNCPGFNFPVCVSGKTYQNICFARADGKYGECGRDMKPGRCDSIVTNKQEPPKEIVSGILPSLKPTNPISITSTPPHIVSAPMPIAIPKPVGIRDNGFFRPVKFKPDQIVE